MNTSDKGQIAALKFELRALEKGLIASKPTGEGCRYDYVIDDGTLKRVQIKYCNSKTTSSQGAYGISLRTLNKNGGQITFNKYSNNEVDLFIIYLPETDKLYVFDAKEFHGKSGFTLRVRQPLKKFKNCRMAQDYEW